MLSVRFSYKPHFLFIKILYSITQITKCLYLYVSFLYTYIEGIYGHFDSYNHQTANISLSSPLKKERSANALGKGLETTDTPDPFQIP